MKIKRIGEDAFVPYRATDGAGGYDLCVYAPDKPVQLDLNQVVKVRTGIAMEIPKGYVGILSVRSSFAKRSGVQMMDSVGIIDSDYRGEVMMLLKNIEGGIVFLHHGDRIAQITIVPCLQEGIEIVNTLSETQRGCGGFGSTGKIN